ncbi:BAHD acyltransferase-like [Dorcoceras hygrometricum]|uniref:BAHD acyltransferase-like n=1 Tax=Dorcoceras hygrometricum TaxID=472368 RepID=A0A2Z6ZX87_9LAMI|nr:BAHD acyltransferase-like [Dorcoceras hygrometricum]
MTMKLLQNDNSRQEAKPGDHVCEIQVNRFECGGLAVSVVVSHCVADAVTLCTFLRGWAAAARSTGGEISPDFNGQNVFPPLDVMDRETMLFPSDMSTYMRTTKYVTKRYVFDASIIAKLKERARSDSSVVAVSAFIWKVYMNVFKEKSDLEKTFIQMQVVNLRTRAVPALPDESFGNMYWLTAAKCTSPADSNLEDLAGEVKRAIKKLDSGFVQALKDGGYHQKLEETKKGFPRGSQPMGISSWCRFGWYDIDFGWGKPVWISLAVCGDSETVAANGATFMDTRFNDGIEAWMTLAQDYVASFEENEDIKNYVLIDPSPLQITCKRI